MGGFGSFREGVGIGSIHVAGRRLEGDGGVGGAMGVTERPFPALAQFYRESNLRESVLYPGHGCGGVLVRNGSRPCVVGDQT